MPENMMLQEVVGDAKVIFDIGAKCGKSALRYVNLFPLATIYAFEPAPGNYEALVSATCSRRVIAMHCAVLEKPGQAEINIYTHKGSHSVLRLDEWEEATLWETVTVPATSVDEFCARTGIQHIDLLKVDTEGSELAVLKGATTLLSKGAVGTVYVELMYYPYFKGQCRPEDVIEFLGSFGMQVVATYPEFCPDGEMRYANAIFSR